MGHSWIIGNQSSITTESNPWQILLVEDSLTDICLFRLALRDAELHAELTAVPDGAEAVGFVERQGKYATACRPELAVIDLTLPKNGGVEVLAAIRSSEGVMHIPAVVLTSLASVCIRDKIERLGVDRQIPKPFTPAEFLQMVVLSNDILEKGLRRVAAAAGTNLSAPDL